MAKSLKQKIKDGDVVVALRPPITISKADFEKALTKGSYDLVYIDGQHTPFSDEQLVAWVRSGTFQRNPIGVEFDPEVLARRLAAGDPLSELVQQGSAPRAS